MTCPLHSVDIYSEDVKALVGKTAGSIAQIKAVVPDSTSSCCILQHCTLAVKNKNVTFT